jgi:acetyltransferase-like isoleucine patch superfamily enzyme
VKRLAPILILSIVIIAFIVLFAILAFIGKKLNLFSSNQLDKSVPFVPMRLGVYFFAGLVWILAKIHFPGIETVVTYSFDNKMGVVLRAAYWKSRLHRLGKDVIVDVGAKAIGWHFISIDDNSWIDRNVILEAGPVSKDDLMVYVKKTTLEAKEGELKIGKGCHISKNVVIQAYGGVIIGDYSGIASGAKIYSLSHHYKNINVDDGKIYKFTPCAPTGDQSLIQGSVVLEGNNALGLNSVILPGVTIGKNTWIGVCSYVVNDIPPNSIAAGSPAKVTKSLQNGQGEKE